MFSELAPLAPVIHALTVVGGKPMVVGGFVRDWILGLESKDIDIEVHGLHPEGVERALRSVGVVDSVGKAFGVFKIRCGGLDIDVSLPRTDSKTGDRHGDFTVSVDPFMGFEAACTRRDFTINSIMLDPSTGKIVDPFDGMSDIHDGVLRAVGPAFEEDPLRVLRAVQFAARFGFRIDRWTARVCRSLSLDDISIERIWSEWDKIGRKGSHWTALSNALNEVGLHDRFGLINAFQGDLTDLFGDERTAFVLTGLGVDLDSIDCPLAIRRHVSLLRKGILAAGIGELSQAQVRSFAPVTPLDIARLMPIDCALDLVLGAPAPLLTGADLISAGLNPGPSFGRILKDALWCQDTGVFSDRDGALAWLEVIIKS